MPTRQSMVEFKVQVTGSFACNGRIRSEIVSITGTHDTTDEEAVMRAVNSVGISSISVFYPRKQFKNISGTIQATRPPAPVLR